MSMNDKISNNKITTPIYFVGVVFLRFNYYTALLEEATRIEKDVFGVRDEILAQKPLHDRWRDEIMDRLYTDFLPPIERRDLLTLVQNMGYVAYEVRECMLLKSITSAEGEIMRQKLQNTIKVLRKETEALEQKKSAPKNLRDEVYSLLSLWRDSVKSGGNPTICDGFEAVADAILRYADALETVCVLE